MSVRVLIGDAREQLATLPSSSVHCVVTSPPYWGLRAYQGDPGMIGLEATFDEHLANLVEVFREVWRVLRPDGNVWLNYGDAYSSGNISGHRNGSGRADGIVTESSPRNRNGTPGMPGLKPKDLLMMPARVALALQSDGWWLRSEIVWHKPNPMPESVTDRPTSAHEKLYLLTKQPRYFYDAEAVRLPPSGRTDPITGFGRSKEVRADAERTYELDARVGANLRNVWSIPTSPFSAAHFATFPPALVEPCIKAGTSERGVCGDCGAPWVRVVEGTTGLQAHEEYAAGQHAGNRKPPQGGQAEWSARQPKQTTGWRPTCDHHAAVIPATVLDPFGGAGTVGLVADRLQRDAILIEISPEYAEMARQRIEGDAPLFAQVAL